MARSIRQQKVSNRSVRTHKDADQIIARIANWSEFKAALRHLTETEQGIVFERFAQLFLTSSPVYSSKLKDVWLLHEVPGTIATKLRLPSRDVGIDIVAQTKDGEFWAVQCKYRTNEGDSVSYRELSTFVASSARICKNFSFELVITSTDRVTHLLSNLPTLGIIAADSFRSLDKEIVRLMKAQLSRTKSQLRPLTPRSHQIRAIANAQLHFVRNEAKRGKLIWPCGSGKSLTAFWISQALKARTILVAVPSLALVKQSLRTWLRESVANEIEVDWLCVCSDASAGQPEMDNFISYTHDLGVPCTTDGQEVAWWLNKSKRKYRVIFATYQSAHVISAAARKSKTTFDLGILDEAHKTAGRRDNLFSHLLFESNVKISRRLFMTATERRYIGTSDQIMSMEDPEMFGETFELLSFKDALNSKPPILADYQVVTISVTDTEVQNLLADDRYVKPTKGEWSDFTAKDLARVLALRKAMNKYPVSHAISFHNSIGRAKQYKDLQDELSRNASQFGHLDTVHVSGNMSTAVRDRHLNDFIKSERALVTNARCLTEGIDIPAVDCVFFADSKNSTIDIVQAAGRALRVAPEKKKGFIIVPLFHRSSISMEALFESQEFKEVVTVIRSLASNDERIIDYFRSLRFGTSRNGKPLVDFDCTEIVPAEVDVATFERALQLKVWGRLAKLSWRPFEEARAYVRSLELKSQIEWARFSCSGQRPEDIPGNPAKAYKDSGWISLGDWLGTGSIAPRYFEYRPFAAARSFVHALGLRSQSEWDRYCKNDKKPQDIPAAPRSAYKDHGWISMGDWLGTGSVAPQLKEYRSFEKARAFVRKLGLRSHEAWKEYKRSGKKPNDIPGQPDRAYKDFGWISYGDWLGTERVANRLREYRDFESAREFVQGLRLINAEEWWKFAGSSEKPDDIRYDPYKYKEFKGMGDWLGTDAVASKLITYRSFVDAREFARSLKLRSWDEWLAYCRSGSKPMDIPTNANQVYRNDGWVNTGDWLGTGRGRNRQYQSFENARDYVRSLGLNSQSEWAEFCKSGAKPYDIPTNPAYVYADNGWNGVGDWLGTGNIAPRYHNYNYRNFSQARSFVRTLGLKTQEEWLEFCRSDARPANIPMKPDRVYKESGWKGFGDWLGTGRVATQNREYRTFKAARAFARSLGLYSQHEWFEFCRSGNRPEDIPIAVITVYKDQWNGWQDWLGYKKRRPRKIYREFEQARKFVCSLGLQSANEWRDFCRSGDRPEDIPSNPNDVYKQSGWKSWGDWLGCNSIAVKDKNFKPFLEARKFVRSLGLRSGQEWRRYAGSKARPDDIPYNPASTYASKGWRGMADWLGY